MTIPQASHFRRLIPVITFLVALVLYQCHQGLRTYRFTRFSMDTVVEYTLLAPDRTTALTAVNAAHREMQRLDSLFWEENPASPIYQFNHAQITMVLPDTVVRFLQRVRHYWEITGGLFDPTIKPVLDLYQLEAQHPVPPDSQQLKSALALVGYSKIQFQGNGWVKKDQPGVALALGGVAKGYAVDRAVAILQQYGISGGIVNAGGDLRCWRNDGQFWHIGIQHPRKNTVLAILQLQNAAVATSGDYQRYYIYQDERYHHLIDPRTGEPGRLSSSATVIAPNCELADAVATAIFLMGADRGIVWVNDRAGIEALVVDAAGAIHQSSGMKHFLMEIKQ